MNDKVNDTGESSGSLRSILITGASSGIGECAAHGLRARGYRVFASARKIEDVQRLREQGFETVQLDVANSASIRTAVEEVLRRNDGKLGGLFNNAGYGQPGAVEDLTRDALKRQFEVNVFGAHELIRLIIPVMRAQGGGRIVQNSSVLGLVAMRYRGAYNASKFALEGLCDTLRLELRDTPIRIILIEPGPIQSRFRDNSLLAFRREVNLEQSFHQDRYADLMVRLRKAGPAVPFTLGPEAVLRALIRALEDPNPKDRYFVTFPTHLFAMLKRVLPTRWLDPLLARY